ncbi:vesicle coat protein [Xylaria sp. CBS 124048]|nr:vesicle coat protein [Xylaria sp. CBS 124048]
MMMTAVSEGPAVFPILTNDIQLCLAHYCDLHGPTPLMVTEGLPVPCGRCYNEHLVDVTRPRSSAAVSTGVQTTAVVDVLQKLKLESIRRPSTSPNRDAQTHRASSLSRASNSGRPIAAITPTTSTLAMQTPPQSPQSIPSNFSPTTASNTNTNNSNNTANGNASSARRDASFQRTYDDYATKRASPCANCALTLPKRQSHSDAVLEPDGAASRPVGNTDSKSDILGPTLRTRAPYARVYGSIGVTSPPCSTPQSSSTSDAEDEISPAFPRRRTTSTSQSSSISKFSAIPHHTHYLDYTSTHEPIVSSTYTIVRASCLRTLSFETLPRRPEAHSTTASSTNPNPPWFSAALSNGPGYITAPPSTQSASSGGPIFFGDPSAGYTTAYIFRIPDIHARGRKRVYAFLALSTHRERLAMKAFSFISAAFHDLATWIQELAELEAEREQQDSQQAGTTATYGNGNGSGLLGSRGSQDSGIGLGGGLDNKGSPRERDRENTTSSFLTGGGRAGYMQRLGMGGSMGPGGFTPKARGLAELVGLPDFFIELHSRFVKLLLELGVILGS